MFCLYKRVFLVLPCFVSVSVCVSVCLDLESGFESEDPKDCGLCLGRPILGN